MTEKHEHALADIKTLFDGIKNLGLCVAFALGLQWFQAPLDSFGFSRDARALINLMGLVSSCALTALAITWLCFSFKQEPKSKVFYRFSLFILGATTLVVMAVIIEAAWTSIPHTLRP
ncbi:hypothetical protein NRB16_07475 [Pseudomonas sp. LJDD11]|uniref:hypothetical protein n=1 Tax=Pseudomonas sp. LJDD11 TaxID=2931984 RepID=UPI00211BF921|nr:hypothetical protein [Pseudomonas sp. LJDD11]MCQ9423362.1 hypothetical protein [Pseudomonas sp. LJDD11]